MALLKNEMQQTNIHMGISLTQMTRKTKYQSEKIEKILSSLCALLNSRGGRLELHCLEKNTMKIPSCVRTIEQHLIGMIGITATMELVKLQVNQQQIIFNIKESSKLVTINYNLYFPTQTQISAIPATTPIEDIKHILERKIVDDCVLNGSHMKEFEKGKESRLQENEFVQLKILKDTSTKNVTLADRIAGKSNKLACYISAFANHRGGHLYYGISAEGLVAGQFLNEKEKDDIEKKVEKAINKMIWPPEVQPRKGKQWDILFEPVLDDDNSITSLFVIVIYIAPCPGGVFTEQPESYYLNKGKVTKMSFDEWRGKFTGIQLTKNIPRLQWSSEKNQKVFRELTTRLVLYRNDEDMEDFEKLTSKALSETFSDEFNVKLIVMTECITIKMKRLLLQKANDLLKKFQEGFEGSPDRSIFEVRMLFLKSRLELTEGKYMKSYDTIQEGLQKMTIIPVELHTLFFYMEACLLTTILSAKEKGMKERALRYLQLAGIYVSSIEDLTFEKMSDFQIKLHIYKALVHLGCCITGETEPSTPPSEDDIRTAAKDLATVEEITLQGNHCSRFRQIEYNLAKCDLLNRRSDLFQEGNLALKEAYNFAEKAHILAKKHHFENMVHYATIRRRNITARLVCKALCSRNKYKTGICLDNFLNQIGL